METLVFWGVCMSCLQSVVYLLSQVYACRIGKRKYPVHVCISVFPKHACYVIVHVEMLMMARAKVRVQLVHDGLHAS